MKYLGSTLDNKDVVRKEQLPDEATQTDPGLMSAKDKKKLDGIAEGATANAGTVTSVATGAGLTGGPITGSGTIKVKLKSETQSSLTAADKGSTSSREYAVGLDASGNLSVNVPWTDTTGVTGVKGNAESSYRTGQVNITPANIGAAPLASPAFTGTPTAPTASAGTNTTQIATTAFVVSEVARILGAIPLGKTLENCSWEEISNVSSMGMGAALFSVGDTKSIALSGTCGMLSLSTTLYCYILGFNHNSAREGSGISFGTFKTTASNGTDVCLVDSGYGSNYTDGTKRFNMNHWGNYNYGGWKGCDLRYDVLGSTNSAPSGYGSAVTTSRVGYDAGTSTATSPVSGTLMSCLPSALRAVMKPITKYTDNKGNSSNVLANVTTSVDYLPLLAEYEIFGARTYANQYENTDSKQAQYQYYKNGNSKVKYRHSSTGSAASWWERSPNYNGANYFCSVGTGGSANCNIAYYSFGLAPAFMI